MQIGDKIRFGRYEWRVLDIQNDMALIITDEIIEQRAYHDAYKEITWADCALRKYLNGTFYETFDKVDQYKIVMVTNKNLNNQWYGTEGGADTLDLIFILSLEEVCKYFGDSRSLLQNPGINQRFLKAAYIFGTDGNIGIQGNNVLKGNISDGKCTGGVRPALWLKLELDKC